MSDETLRMFNLHILYPNSLNFYRKLIIIMDDNMIPALEHKQTTRYLYVKQNLNDQFPVLALLLSKLRAFRPKILKPGARQKGTYCIQCVLKEDESKNLFSFDISKRVRRKYQKSLRSI